MVPEGYKKTRVGIIPEDWEVKKLEQICEKNKNAIKPGPFGSALKKETYVSSGYKVYGQEQVISGDFSYGDYYIDEKKYNELCNFKIQSKDMLISLVGTFGKIVIVPDEFEEGIINPRLMKISFDETKANVFYYRYYMISEPFFRQLESMSHGGTMGILNKKIITSIRYITPPLQEQEKIANILSTWDKAIEKIEKLIKEKEIQKKGLMQELLTGKTRLVGFTGEWKEVRLGEVVTRAKGKAVEISEDGIYPILGIEALNTNQFIDFTNDERVLAEKDDILLLWDGAAAGSVFTNVEGAVGSTFMRLRPKNINSVFIREYMKRDEQYIKNIREGSGIPHVPRDFLDYYKIDLPPLPEQKAIAQILSTADKEIELLKQLLEYKKEEKKGLMQLLLTGIVRV